MKKLFLGLMATLMLTGVAFGQASTNLQSTVTTDEYKAMDELDRKIVNYVDAGIAALKGMNLNEPAKRKYTASVSLSIKGNSLDNNIIVAESDGEPNSAQSCVICNLTSGRACFKRIRTQLANGPVVITVEQVSDCISLSW